MDVSSQKAGDSKPESVISGGEVSYYKYNGMTKKEFIAQLKVTDVEKYLCKNMVVTLAYKETST